MEHKTPDSSTLKEELRGDAEKVATAATQRLETEADGRKGQVAGQAHQLSSALGTAARELGSEGPGWIRSALEQGARSVEQLAQTVDRKDTRQLVSDVQQFARERPRSFLAGCAFAGFAAARVLKAGAASHADASRQEPAAEPTYDPYVPQTTGESTPMMTFSDGGGAAASAPPHTQGTSL